MYIYICVCVLIYIAIRSLRYSVYTLLVARDDTKNLRIL